LLLPSPFQDPNDADILLPQNMRWCLLSVMFPLNLHRVFLLALPSNVNIGIAYWGSPPSAKTCYFSPTHYFTTLCILLSLFRYHYETVSTAYLFLSFLFTSFLFVFPSKSM
jgi:hypothetical protein